MHLLILHNDCVHRFFSFGEVRLYLAIRFLLVLRPIFSWGSHSGRSAYLRLFVSRGPRQVNDGASRLHILGDACWGRFDSRRTHRNRVVQRLVARFFMMGISSWRLWFRVLFTMVTLMVFILCITLLFIFSLAMSFLFQLGFTSLSSLPRLFNFLMAFRFPLPFLIFLFFFFIFLRIIIIHYKLIIIYHLL